MSKRERKRLIVVQGGVHGNNSETDCTGSGDSILSIFGSRSFKMIAKSGENIVKKCKRHLIKC